MAGIYIHIPFCRQACHYCDFHFSTSLSHQEDMVRAMLREIGLQRSFLGNLPIETIYFGGGTPSLLSGDDINRFLDAINRIHTVTPSPEITLEANPDDLTGVKVRELRQTAVNRFSIGVQSFFEEDLRWMNRAHTATEADGAVKRVQDAGFEHITLDLIYGYPLLSDEKWYVNLQKTIALDVPHLSAYSMTVEPQTALAAFIRKGKQQAMDDEQSARQLIRMMDVMQEAGYEQYEISNFARPGQYARHNSNYWQGIPYVGIGPSAHSYTGEQRQWNVANNLKYITSLQQGQIPFEYETLTKADRLNEYIMTSLRTSRGMDLQHIDQHFGSDYGQMVREGLHAFIEKGEVNMRTGTATLSASGKLLADHIAAMLFVSAD